MAITNIELADYPISSVNIDGTGWMLNEMANWTGNVATGVVKIANSGLDGGGTLKTLLTAASNGTYIKTVTITTQTTVRQGIIRLFINDGVSTTRLLMEIEIMPWAKSSATLTGYQQIVGLDFNLKSGYKIMASTEFADTYNITIEGLDWAYP